MFRPRLRGKKLASYNYMNKEERRILVIGDIHSPFELEGYLQFCKDTYANYNCNQVIFIGDIIDNHASSFHTSDPDGMGGGDELDLAIERIQEWSLAFPVADVMIGNHDRIIMRKAFDGQIPARWIKDYNDVGKNFKVFGMQVGCGVDSKTYAAAYAKNFKKQAIGCGVVLGGHTAINCLMNL